MRGYPRLDGRHSMPPGFSFDVLPDGGMVLTLRKACIQGTARQAHHELATALIEGRAAGPMLETLAELLAQFLTSTDFAALRAEHAALAAGSGCRVKLYRSDDGTVRWEALMQGADIP